MSDRRYEVYEISRRGAEVTYSPLSSIPDDLVEKAAKAIDRRDETWLRDGGDHRFIHSTTLARAALSVLFPKETE